MRKFIVCAAMALAGCSRTSSSEEIKLTRSVHLSRPSGDEAPPPIKRIARVVVEFDDGTSAEATEKK